MMETPKTVKEAGDLLDSFGYTLVNYIDPVDGQPYAALDWQSAGDLAARFVADRNAIGAAFLREAATRYREVGLNITPTDLEVLADYLEENA